ncbi:hypothetical protein [Azospirillum sp. SYSU D00513]|uniref:hypothetical protein n=1 Tax=Azospirillum sp. SYSU D00513 TaxID=2812561 RepID=UPI001A96D698|nr:hypothetical protein [Azospirillum sp. SYSU D00513]
MLSLSTNQLKLYRKVLHRQLDGVEQLLGRKATRSVVFGTDISASGTVQTEYGDTIAWKIAFDAESGDWVVSMQAALFSVDSVTRRKTLGGTLEEFWVELQDLKTSMQIHRLQEELDHDLDEDLLPDVDYEAMDKAERAARIAAIPSLSDTDLREGYAAADEGADRAWTAWSEWDWHPDYTGPDDPGKDYYERKAHRASELLDAYQAEMTRRGFLN